jgi:hypothetical protein
MEFFGHSGLSFTTVAQDSIQLVDVNFKFIRFDICICHIFNHQYQLDSRHNSIFGFQNSVKIHGDLFFHQIHYHIFIAKIKLIFKALLMLNIFIHSSGTNFTLSSTTTNFSPFFFNACISGFLLSLQSSCYRVKLLSPSKYFCSCISLLCYCNNSRKRHCHQSKFIVDFVIFDIFSHGIQYHISCRSCNPASCSNILSISLILFQSVEADGLDMAWFLAIIADDSILIFFEHLGLAVC